MNDAPKAITSLLAALVSWVSIEQAATVLAGIASIVAILAGLPVVVDRWGPNVRRWFFRK